MLSRNPIPCASRQVQKASRRIAKNILHGGILRRIIHQTRDMETEGFTAGINDQHAVADVEVAQTPKHCWVSARAIKMSSNHRAAPFAWTRTRIVPANIVPGTLSWCFHCGVRSNAYRLDRGIDTYGRNEQAREWWWSRTCCDRGERLTSHTEGQGYHCGEHSPEQPRRTVRGLLTAERPQASEQSGTHSPQSEYTQ